MDFDVLNVEGKAALAGILFVNFENGFQPVAGTKFVLIRAAGGVTGSFLAVTSNATHIRSGQDSNTFYVVVE